MGIYEILRQCRLFHLGCCCFLLLLFLSFRKYGGELVFRFLLKLITIIHYSMVVDIQIGSLHPSFCLCVSVCVSMYSSTYLPIISR